MQFLKKNYEKILLAVVVLAALGVVAYLPILVSQEKQKLDDLLNGVIHKAAKPMAPADFKQVDAFLQRAQNRV